MSELDTYLLVSLFCAVCGFFIGLGQEVIWRDQVPDDDSHPTPTAGARIAFSFTSLVGIGYFIAWIWGAHQPIIKLVPVFILAALAGRLGGGVASDRVGTWLPVLGMILMPATFHVARYFGVI